VDPEDDGRQAVSFDKAAEDYIVTNEQHWAPGVAGDARSAIARCRT